MVVTDATGFPVRFVGGLSDYAVPPGDAGVLEQVTRYVEHLSEMRQVGKGLLLTGDPGVGKTLLACAVGQAAVERGFSARFMPLALYIRKIQYTFDLKGLWPDQEAIVDWKDQREDLLRIRNAVDFLVLDDVGKEHLTGSRFAEDEFDFLVRYRYDRGLPTIITTNQQISAWGERYSESMESFMYECCLTITTRGEDARRL